MFPAKKLIPVLTVYDDLTAIQTELNKCMHCGFCMAACPIYKTTKTESGVARGKIGIAEAVIAGELQIEDQDVIDTLFNCLVCKSCMQSCPTKVDFAQIILALRCAVVREKGLPWVKKAIFSTLKHQGIFNLGMKTGARMSGLLFRQAGQQAITPRSPLAWLGSSAGFDQNRLLPALTKKPLRDRLPNILPVEKPILKVAFFTGCSFNYLYPETGEDLVSVLQENHVQVVIPPDQGCCGVPLFVHGDIESMRQLGKKNIVAMDHSDIDYIVTGCGSCGGAWQHDYPEIFKHDPVYGPRADYWRSHTYDISTLLTKIIRYRLPRGQVNTIITYHDPCHLKKVMKVANEPREILKHIPGVIYKEMTRADACCGSSGSYVLTHFDTSVAIAKRKIDDANQTEADTIATGCPACIMQLVDNVQRFGHQQQVRHYISILAESYRKEKKVSNG